MLPGVGEPRRGAAVTRSRIALIAANRDPLPPPRGPVMLRADETFIAVAIASLIVAAIARFM